ncbi:FecR family protein [Pedobacter nutrimenti]|uniref:FecR family protein n=1 Tax=Pedobacter nutrimenti TaxID=1241337 RepID=UPI00292E30DF|nr:FecR family protein [Pedobacter nutrimenti]
MKNKEAKSLLEKYKSGTLSEEEQALLDSWYLQEAKSKSGPTNPEDMQNQLESIWTNLPVHHNVRKLWNKKTWFKVAAALIIFSTGIILYNNHHSQSDIYTNIPSRQKIVPGGNKATLILANGTRINLNNASNGQIVKQAGLTITKTKEGQLVYKVADNGYAPTQGGLNYNTIETPNGGQYQVYLPDGTKVWLNATSSLKYPIQFSTKERRVELTGEGYFEVAHNKTKPFKVVTTKQEIEVLGTHFNINAYADENATKTTLLEGSVKIKTHATKEIVQQSIVLKPGQQSSIDNKLLVKYVNSDDVIAWQKGYFKFNQENIQSIMRKLSRWYNVEVVFQTEIDPSVVFGGKISQTKNLSAILRIMEETGNVHFKIEGRRVIVMK